MVLVRSSVIDNRSALFAALNDALRLEHATIPPYLTAWLTLRETGPGPILARKLLRQIFVDEMRHMQIVANLLIAFGERPAIANAQFVPHYPAALPRGIGDDDAPGGLIVPIVRYSRATVRDVYMQIEEPETPIDLPVLAGFARGAGTYQTIGQFYAAIAAAIENSGEELFIGDPGLQVVDDEIAAITDVATALAAIERIRLEGEGTPDVPIDQRQRLAHYYRFESLVKGMEVVPRPAAPGFAYDPARPIVIDDDLDVIPMIDNPGAVPLPAGSRAAELSDACDRAYSDVLRELHRSFNGEPGNIDAASFAMVVFTGAAEELLSERLDIGPQAGMAPGPRYLWVEN